MGIRVPHKRRWYQIQAEGVFNTTFNASVEEYRRRCAEWPMDKIFCIRTMGHGGGVFDCRPHVELWRHLTTNIPPEKWENIRVSEQAPDEAILVQGEFDGTTARISFEKTPMRFALQKSEHNISRVALMGLIGYRYYRHLMDILDDFEPGAVVEWSLYGKAIGIHKERLIIWEVRHY